MYLFLFCLCPLKLLHSFDEISLSKENFCFKYQIKRELCLEERGATQRTKIDYLADSQSCLKILKNSLGFSKEVPRKDVKVSDF